LVQLEDDEDLVEPVCDVCFPLYNDLDKIQYNTDDANSSEIVGAVTSTFYWRDMMKNMLPKSHAAIDIVIDNPCKASFTYQIMYVCQR
jgi:hypothetical protein